jgi:hypothetical protein
MLTQAFYEFSLSEIVPATFHVNHITFIWRPFSVIVEHGVWIKV